MVEGDQARRVWQADNYLCSLPERSSKYRAKWVHRADHVRPDKINVDAVARVVADYLTIHGDSGTTHRAKNDTIRGALEGATLAAEMLNAFISAFKMSNLDAEKLVGLLDGTPADVIPCSGRTGYQAF